MICNKCGKPIPDSSKYCSYCGATNLDYQYNRTDISIDKEVKRRSKAILPIIIVFIIIVVGIGGFFIFQIMNGNNSGKLFHSVNNNDNETAWLVSKVYEDGKLQCSYEYDSNNMMRKVKVNGNGVNYLYYDGKMKRLTIYKDDKSYIWTLYVYKDENVEEQCESLLEEFDVKDDDFIFIVKYDKDNINKSANIEDGDFSERIIVGYKDKLFNDNNEKERFEYKYDKYGKVIEQKCIIEEDGKDKVLSITKYSDYDKNGNPCLMETDNYYTSEHLTHTYSYVYVDSKDSNRTMKTGNWN